MQRHGCHECNKWRLWHIVVPSRRHLRRRHPCTYVMENLFCFCFCFLFPFAKEFLSIVFGEIFWELTSHPYNVVCLFVCFLKYCLKFRYQWSKWFPLALPPLSVDCRLIGTITGRQAGGPPLLLCNHHTNETITRIITADWCKIAEKRAGENRQRKWWRHTIQTKRKRKN